VSSRIILPLAKKRALRPIFARPNANGRKRKRKKERKKEREREREREEVQLALTRYALREIFAKKKRVQRACARTRSYPGSIFHEMRAAFGGLYPALLLYPRTDMYFREFIFGGSCSRRSRIKRSISTIEVDQAGRERRELRASRSTATR